MTRFIKFKSIRTRLLVWFLLVALIPLFIVSLVMYAQDVRTIKDDAFAKLTGIRDLKIAQVNAWLAERIGDVRTVASDFEIRSLEQVFAGQENSDQSAVEAARNVLLDYVSHTRDYHELFVIDAETGKVAFSSDNLTEGLDKSDDPYFTEPLRTQQVYIKDIYYSEALGEHGMTFSAPVSCLAHQGEHVFGVVVARVDLDHSLYALLLDRAGMGKTGETLIVNADVLALNELRWQENAPLRLQIQAEPAVRAAQGNEGIVETTDYRQEKVLAAYSYIPATKWGFVAKQDQAEVYAPIRGMLRYTIGLLFVSGIIVVLIAFYIARSLAQPVIAMTRVAEKIRAGELTARNPASGPDELGFLADSFNSMADSMADQMAVQQGVADLIATMVSARELEEAKRLLLERLLKLTASDLGAFHVLSADEARFEHAASVGISPDLLAPFDVRSREGEFGKVLSTGQIAHLRDIPEDTLFTFKTFMGTVLPREIITVPVLVGNRVQAVISLACLQPYSSQSLAILKQSWMSLNAAFSNLLAGEETARLAHTLNERNEELQAQAVELQKQNEEITAQRRQVEEANRLKSEFLSNMSHELRTPLNSILVLSRVLAGEGKETLSDEHRQYLEIVERNGKDLLNTINDILDLSKIEAGRMEISPERLSVARTVGVIMDSLAPIAADKGIRLEQDVHEDLELESDPARVRQILQNLLSNAVKFTESGSVSVTAELDSDEVCIRVVDTGIGIAEHELAHVFDEFRQVDGSSSRSFGGTGLGLAIARKNARLLGGDVSVTSQRGEGSIFTLKLPVRYQGPGPGAVLSALQPSPVLGPERKTILEGLKGPTTASQSGPSPSGKRILLVEDNEVVVIQVRMALEQAGFVVDAAPGGREALVYVKNTIPDGIVLDLMMPGVNGFEVLDAIRSDAATRTIPVLILTAKELTPEERSKLSANNIQELIQKGDVDRAELLRKVKQMMGVAPRPDQRQPESPPESEPKAATAPREGGGSRGKTEGPGRGGQSRQYGISQGRFGWSI